MKLPQLLLTTAILCNFGISGTLAGNVVTDIKVLPVVAGLNHLTREEGNIPEVQVIKAWRERGNAWSHWVFHVFVHRRTSTLVGGSQLLDVPIINAKGDEDPMLLADTPYDGEQTISAIAFATGSIADQKAFFVINSRREWDRSKDVGRPAKTVITIYKLGALEESGYQLERLSSMDARLLYCNADLALYNELHLPVPSELTWLTGSKDGCAR